MILEIERENLRLIFDRDKAILSDEDYARLAALVEDESDADNTHIDHDFDFESGN